MTYYLSDLIGSEFVVHCPTQGECDEFLAALDEYGVTWSVEAASSFNYFDLHKKKTCFRINSQLKLNFCDPEFYLRKGYDIIPFSELSDGQLESTTLEPVTDDDLMTFLSGGVL